MMFLRTHRLKKNNGFTLIEALIGMGIVCVALAMAALSTIQLKSQFKKSDQKINSTILTSRIASTFVVESGHFPVVVKNSIQGSYVQCFNRKGVPEKIAGQSNTIEVFFPNSETEKSNLCKSDLEVRITPNNGSALIEVIDNLSDPIKILSSTRYSIPAQF